MPFGIDTLRRTHCTAAGVAARSIAQHSTHCMLQINSTPETSSPLPQHSAAAYTYLWCVLVVDEVQFLHHMNTP